MIKRGIGLLIFALLGSVAAHAQGTVTFDGTPMGSDTDYLTEFYTESGLSFTAAPGSFGFSHVGDNCPGHPVDGSAYLQAGYGNSLMFKSVDCSTFSLVSVDLAEFRTTMPGAATVSFTGYRLDGSSVSASFATDGTANFKTFDFGSGWTDLTRVVVPGGGGPNQGWSMDNVVFAVPEPSVGALLIVGVLILQLRKMKRASLKPAFAVSKRNVR